MARWLTEPSRSNFIRKYWARQGEIDATAGPFGEVKISLRRSTIMWQKLEQGLLLAFKDLYDPVPKYNTHGKNMVWTDQGDYISKTGLKNIIRRYG